MSVRFAPSPTGRFHIGNLRTAWISHAFSRALAMPWLVRFEDIDAPRVIAGAMQVQLEDLRALGMNPEQILIQSEHRGRHEALFREAITTGQVYPCGCSRKELSHELQNIASAPHGSIPLYSGRCRNPKDRVLGSHPTLAWRFMNPQSEGGEFDFVIARTNRHGEDFVPSYHWACAIDDFDGGHALLVRASDLAQAEALQASIRRWVADHSGAPVRAPAVFHAALITSDDGGRLEKRTKGVTLSELVNQGISSEEVLRRLDASFDRNLLLGFMPGKIWGENPGKLSLSKIGFQ